MIRFILKRMLMMIPILLGVAFIIFTITSLTPGDPGTLILGPYADEASIHALNEKLGFNDPFLIRFGKYVVHAVTGDFGVSYRTSRPVFEEIFAKMPLTLQLVLISQVFSVFIGIPLGVMSAVKQYSALDFTTTFFSLLFASIPSFWLAFMAIMQFSVKLKWFPVSGAEDMRGLVLPCLILGLSGAATLARLVRSTMLEVIRQDYITTARAKGTKERLVIFAHALRNALIPIVTVVGIGFAAGLGGSVLIETVFGLPGVGAVMVNAIQMKDIPVVMAGVLLLATIFSVTNLLVDLLYGFIDPRIKAKYKN
ncbi:MAG TPA: ABC transporter permease [Clostridia bacterium]|nr:ABC transporter permease [Clostridia bacterium]